MEGHASTANRRAGATPARSAVLILSWSIPPGSRLTQDSGSSFRAQRERTREGPQKAVRQPERPLEQNHAIQCCHAAEELVAEHELSLEHGRKRRKGNVSQDH